MKLKILLLAAVSVVIAAPLFAQHAAAPRTPADQQTLDWLRAGALGAAGSGSDVTRGSPVGHGQLRIIPLSEWDAPPSITQSVAQGIMQQSKGSLTVASGAIPSTDEVIGRLSNTRRSDAELKQRLGYAPADISATPIGAAELLSTEPNGTISGGRSTGVSRAYRAPNVGVIILSEDDYHASKTEITLIRETLNEDVNGVPARVRGSL